LLLFNLQDEDSDDMSSDSDDDGGGGGFFGRLKGAKDGEGADEGGSLFGGRLPPKPLGDWDEVVAVPRHSDRDVALAPGTRTAPRATTSTSSASLTSCSSITRPSAPRRVAAVWWLCV